MYIHASPGLNVFFIEGKWPINASVNYVNIDSDNGNANLLSIGSLGSNSNQNPLAGLVQ